MTASFPKPGDHFQGRYEVLAHIATGGFSQIYCARQLGLDREVALKVLRPLHDGGAPTDPEHWRTWSKRFEQEARLVSQLRDPHTVTVHDYGEADDDIWYIVFEYIDGRTIKEELKKGPMEPERVVRILLQVADSLEEAHGLGVLHRDIKPTNLMLYEHVGRADQVKVLDFGIAKDAQGGEAAGEDLTREGFLLGTPRYMAPEQFRQDELSAATDLYSLGLVAFEMLTAEPAVLDQKTVAIIRRQVDESRFELPDELDAPPWLRNIVARLLSKEPAARFESAAALRDALQAQACEPVESGHGGVFDPNVLDMDDQYGVGDDDDPDVDALRADAAEQNKADASRDPSARRKQQSFGRVDADRLDADSSSDMDITRNDQSDFHQSFDGAPADEAPGDGPDGHESGDNKPHGDDTNQQVSKLTMLGVEQMLRQNRDGGRNRWLLPTLAVVALVAFLGGGYWLYDHLKGDRMETVSVTDKLERAVVVPMADWWAGDRDRFSTEGLQAVIKGAGWKPRGDEGVIQSPTRHEVRQTYRKSGISIDTVIHVTPERADAREVFEGVERPARALLFDTKVVVLRAGTDTDPEQMGGLLALLSRYHEMIVNQG